MTDPDPTAEPHDGPHSFRPRLLATGAPTLVCRFCGGWFDEPPHTGFALPVQTADTVDGGAD
jgi:hypothetical protein